MSSQWWTADLAPSPRVRGEGRGEGSSLLIGSKNRRPLTPTLSPEYGGEGV